jgi:hypothetical protein
MKKIMNKETLRKIIKEWLENQNEYYNIIGDELDMVCLDGYFDFEKLIEKIIIK